MAPGDAEPITSGSRFGLVLDCADPGRLAEFWAPALGYRNARGAGVYLALVSDSGAPKLLLQRVDEPKTVKNRMHLDIEVADIEAEAERLIALGATQLSPEPVHEHGSTWLLMADPEGNEFCVCNAGFVPRRS